MLFGLISKARVFEAMKTLGVDLSAQCQSAKLQADTLEKNAKDLKADSAKITNDAMDKYTREEAKLRAQKDAEMQAARAKDANAAKDLGKAQELRSAAQIFS